MSFHHTSNSKIKEAFNELTASIVIWKLKTIFRFSLIFQGRGFLIGMKSSLQVAAYPSSYSDPLQIVGPSSLPRSLILKTKIQFDQKKEENNAVLKETLFHKSEPNIKNKV
jgi:hypothetical protein